MFSQPASKYTKDNLTFFHPIAFLNQSTFLKDPKNNPKPSIFQQLIPQFQNIQSPHVNKAQSPKLSLLVSPSGWACIAFNPQQTDPFAFPNQTLTQTSSFLNTQPFTTMAQPIYNTPSSLQTELKWPSEFSNSSIAEVSPCKVTQHSITELPSDQTFSNPHLYKEKAPKKRKETPSGSRAQPLPSKRTIVQPFIQAIPISEDEASSNSPKFLNTKNQ